MPFEKIPKRISAILQFVGKYALGSAPHTHVYIISYPSGKLPHHFLQIFQWSRKISPKQKESRSCRRWFFSR